MKNILLSLFALIVSASAFSQELWLNEVDDFTGDSKKATNSQVIGDNQEEKSYAVISISYSTLRVGDTWAFRLKPSSDLGCSGASGNYAMLKFSDGEVMQLEDVAEIDCGDLAESTFILTAELQDRIDAQDAPVMIRLKQADYYTDAKNVNAEVWHSHWKAVAP
jgi:hypothetical protein